MRWVEDDGGRAAAGFTGETRDCVTRAVAIVRSADELVSLGWVRAR